MFKWYNDINTKIEELNTPIKTKIVVGILSFLISLLTFSGAIVLLLNLGIYKAHIVLLRWLFGFIIWLLVYVCICIYYKGITKGTIKGTNLLSLIYSVVGIAPAIIFVIILTKAGF